MTQQQKTTLEQMGRLINGVWCQWPYVEVTPELIRWWHHAFKHLEPDLIARAMMVATKKARHDFPPKIAEVQRALQDLAEASAKTPSPLEAWAFVRHLASLYGMQHISSARRALEKQPIINRAAEIIGWRNICYCQEGDLPFLQKRFVDAYDGLRLKHAQAAGLPELSARDPRLVRLMSGLIESKGNNTKRGLPNSEPPAESSEQGEGAA